MDKFTLGSRLHLLRLKKGYSQHALAERAQVSNVYLSEIERGLKMPSLQSFIKIVEALDASADSILRDELSAGEPFIYDELTQKLRQLTPKQRKAAADILDAFLNNL